MSAHAPKRANGTVTLGMIVARTLRRKRKITITTSAMVIASVNSTSCTEARMFVVRSDRMLTLMVGGIEACSVANAAFIASTVVMTFAPGILYTTRKTLGFPSLQAACVVSWGPATA